MNKIKSLISGLVMQELNLRVIKDIKSFLEEILLAELTGKINSKKHERTSKRRDYLNGYWVRKIQVPGFGTISNLRVPRSRNTYQRVESLKMYQSEGDPLGFEILRGYIFGEKFIDLQVVSEQIFSKILSKNKLKKIVEHVSKSISDYKNRELSSEYSYLILDSVWVVNIAKHQKNIHPLYLVIGAKPDEQYEVIATRMCDNETIHEWENIIKNLRNRGLDTDKIKYAVYGSRHELRDILHKSFPRAAIQRCLNSKMASLSDERYILDVAHKENLTNDFMKAMNHSDKKSMIGSLESLIEHWKDREPRLTMFIKEDMDQLCNFFIFPKEKRETYRTTKLSESVFKNIQDQANVILCYRSMGSEKRNFFE